MVAPPGHLSPCAQKACAVPGIAMNEQEREAAEAKAGRSSCIAEVTRALQCGQNAQPPESQAAPAEESDRIEGSELAASGGGVQAPAERDSLTDPLIESLVDGLLIGILADKLMDRAVGIGNIVVAVYARNLSGYADGPGTFIGKGLRGSRHNLAHHLPAAVRDLEGAVQSCHFNVAQAADRDHAAGTRLRGNDMETAGIHLEAIGGSHFALSMLQDHVVAVEGSERATGHFNFSSFIQPQGRGGHIGLDRAAIEQGRIAHDGVAVDAEVTPRTRRANGSRSKSKGGCCEEQTGCQVRLRDHDLPPIGKVLPPFVL